MIAVEKRVVSTMGFRQESDGRGVASEEGRKLERRTNKAQQEREPQE